MNYARFIADLAKKLTYFVTSLTRHVLFLANLDRNMTDFVALLTKYVRFDQRIRRILEKFKHELLTPLPHDHRNVRFAESSIVARYAQTLPRESPEL